MILVCLFQAWIDTASDTFAAVRVHRGLRLLGRPRLGLFCLVDHLSAARPHGPHPCPGRHLQQEQHHRGQRLGVLGHYQARTEDLTFKRGGWGVGQGMCLSLHMKIMKNWPS